MSSIPIADPVLGSMEKERILEVVDTGQLADGSAVRHFERSFARFCGTETAVATSNGTTALHAALRAVGIGPGDTVVTTPFSFVATANAISHCGATPVFADINADTYTLDPEAVEATIRQHDGAVDAIVPVHLYGLPADMGSLMDIASTYDLAVVEDAAQAHGAEYGGERVGAIGDAGCFSFYPTKNMTTGEGGMIVTDRDDVASRARQFIDHGRAPGDEPASDEVAIGHNFRMSSIAAAIGRAQLEKLPEYTRVRRDYAADLTAGLSDLPGVEVPSVPADRRHVFNQYTIRSDDRSALRRQLESAGIQSSIYYPTPIHEQQAYEVERRFPVAERAADVVLSLPVHPSLTPKEVQFVERTIRNQATAKEGVADA